MQEQFAFHNCTFSLHLSPPFPGASGFSCDYSIPDRLERSPGTAGSSRNRLSLQVHGRNADRCPATRYCNRISLRTSRRIRGPAPLPGASMYYRNNLSCPDRLYNETIMLRRDKCETDFSDFIKFQEKTFWFCNKNHIHNIF